MTCSSREAALATVRRRQVGCAYSHLWSDALFAREQARERDKTAAELQTRIAGSSLEPAPPHLDKMLARWRAEVSQCRWDRGAFVRWTVVTAWMTFERACCDAVGDPKASKGLRERLAKIFQKKGFEAIDWKSGIWADVVAVQTQRHKYIHRELDRQDLFAEVGFAENAVTVIRKGIIAIYATVGKQHPLWADCDEVPWRLGGSSAWATVSSAGADQDPLARRIMAVHGDAEWETRILRSDEDPWPFVAELATNVRVPISAIRIYSGESLLEEIPCQTRGA